MKKDIHPEVFEVKAHCVCGNSFQTTSTEKEISVDICSACHPFCTGTQKFVDTAGRIERFQQRYKKSENASPVNAGSVKEKTPSKKKKVAKKKTEK